MNLENGSFALNLSIYCSIS